LCDSDGRRYFGSGVEHGLSRREDEIDIRPILARMLHEGCQVFDLNRVLADLARGVGAVQFNPLKVEIDRVNLMRSELSPKGPAYTVLDSFALGESGKGGGVWI